MYITENITKQKQSHQAFLLEKWVLAAGPTVDILNNILSSIV